MALCAACMIIGAQAQSSSGSSGSSPSSPSSSGSYSGQSATGHSGSNRHQFSATGRMGHQDLRASQLMGANVTGSTGETLGTISDTIVNTNCGRIDFAILSLNSSSAGASSSPSASSSGSSSSSLGSSSSSSPSSSSGSSTSPSSSSG